MRHRLTESERQAVVALKEACDKEGLHYKHTFELAKYVLVTHSMAKDSNPKSPQIRLNAALKRLRKKNQWMQKNGIDSIDAHNAFVEIYKDYPEYVITRYAKDKDGRVVVAYGWADHPGDFVHSSRENCTRFLAAETYRLDLGAADMDEARKGMCMVKISHGKIGMKGGYRYLRFLGKAKDLLHDMHSNRITQILVEVPSYLAAIVNMGKVILPKKIASRVQCFENLDDLAVHLDRFDRGEQDMSHSEWIQKRREKYEETVEKLAL